MDNEKPLRSKGIYLHFDGIKRTLPFDLADYGDSGALTEDQIAVVAERCDLDTALAKELSILLGYALDLESEVGLVRVKPVKPRKRPTVEENDFKAFLIGDGGTEVQVEPHDKRKVQDVRRVAVIESCCYIWLDAGRRLTFTTCSERLNPDQRSGPLITFIQTVIGMVTAPSCKISGETLRRDIEKVKYRFRMRGDLPEA